MCWAAEVCGRWFVLASFGLVAGPGGKEEEWFCMVLDLAMPLAGLCDS